MNKPLKARIIEVFGTQADFAEAIEDHESNISRVIRGRKALSKKEQKHWADILRCTPENIFKHKEGSQ